MCSTAGPPSLLLVSHKRTGGADRAELVAVTRPMWGSSISAPASWDAFEPDHLQVRQLSSPHTVSLPAQHHVDPDKYSCLSCVSAQSRDTVTILQPCSNGAPCKKGDFQPWLGHKICHASACKGMTWPSNLTALQQHGTPEGRLMW